MKALIQRVSSASVVVEGRSVGVIGKGLCILLGIHQNDTPDDMNYIISRLLNVKLWSDDNGAPWKKTVKDINGELLIISQFTLYAIIGRKGKAPDFRKAMKAETSKHLYDTFLTSLRESYRSDSIKSGIFQAYMTVNIVNDGPVTVEIDSPFYLKNESKDSADTSSDYPDEDQNQN